MSENKTAKTPADGEPVAWVKTEWFTDDVGLQNTREVLYGYEVYGGKPLYTAPPKREWVGLTEEEVHLLWMDMGGRPKINGYDFSKAIEAKLKEKNT